MLSALDIYKILYIFKLRYIIDVNSIILFLTGMFPGLYNRFINVWDTSKCY